MKEILLACDLDNTLIYSYKHRVPGDSCVEWLDGQEQSFTYSSTHRKPLEGRFFSAAGTNSDLHRAVPFPLR